MNSRSVVLGFAAAFAAFSFSVGLRAEVPLRIKVLAWNIRHSEGLDGKTDLDRVAKAIAGAKPDLVALQEVDVGVARTGKIDQAALLAKATNMQVVFGKAIDHDGGEFGNAVLSRWPIAWSKIRPIPRVGREEQRSLLIADIDLPGRAGNLTFLTTQFDHGRRHASRIGAADFVAEFSTLLADDPALFCVDLQSELDSEPGSRLERLWTVANAEYAPTTPANEPAKQWHFVMVRPAERFRVVEVKVLEEASASHHRPVLATLELLPSQAAP
ncbi:MAG TPA: endonuclease/exonuclease/phosphatase family protein [Pirellulaceae bacterium]|jgi:endonuclease/exonuclease/phosphatase family metal-dependent hydrolase|nr:endonuclease/exonuclease/phosphatase family protein [Pirellulaceae bacterium]